MLTFRNDYKIYKSQLIIDHHEQMIIEIERAHRHFTKNFYNMDPTWGYGFYNVFAITAPSALFYDLKKELETNIRDYLQTDQRLWFQSWINYHKPNEVLDWHNHTWPFHGYISIDPKQTKTVFEGDDPSNGYEILNELGNIYIGPGYRFHKVEVLEPFDTPRITLGFDIETRPGLSYEQFSLLPL